MEWIISTAELRCVHPEKDSWSSDSIVLFGAGLIDLNHELEKIIYYELTVNIGYDVDHAESKWDVEHWKWSKDHIDRPERRVMDFKTVSVEAFYKHKGSRLRTTKYPPLDYVIYDFQVTSIWNTIYFRQYHKWIV